MDALSQFGQDTFIDQHVLPGTKLIMSVQGRGSVASRNRTIVRQWIPQG